MYAIMMRNGFYDEERRGETVELVGFASTHSEACEMIKTFVELFPGKFQNVKITDDDTFVLSHHTEYGEFYATEYWTDMIIKEVPDLGTPLDKSIIKEFYSTK